MPDMMRKKEHVSGKIIQIAEAGENILCVAQKGRNDFLTAAYLIETDGTVTALTEYGEPSIRFRGECKLITDGEMFLYYSTSGSEVVFGRLPEQ